MSGTPAAASALAGLYAGMGEAEKAAGVVVKAAEAARRGEHVRQCARSSVSGHVWYHMVRRCSRLFWRVRSPLKAWAVQAVSEF